MPSIKVFKKGDGKMYEIFFDEIDRPIIESRKWYIELNYSGTNRECTRLYAISSGPSGRRLHTTIMGAPPDPTRPLVDHMDGDGLNCVRSNLRWASLSVNARNRHGKKHSVNQS